MVFDCTQLLQHPFLEGYLEIIASMESNNFDCLVELEGGRASLGARIIVLRML